MNCFVASAFNQKDIDAIYDRAVRPVLKEFKIRPLRVDRVEHNDDIDDRIFQLIDESQLCIADLTHARPSVYYEAGYAFGSGKPVIYTARSDHFRPREDDPCGNLRVHFDLQMKNIIQWTAPNDAFRKRLRARLRHVTRPILRKRESEHAERMRAKTFASLSISQQMQSLWTKAVNLLRVRGYSSHRFTDVRFSRSNHYHRDPYHLQLEKKCGRTYRQINLFLRTALNKTEIPQRYSLWIPTIPKEEYGAAKQIESACILVSLRAAQPATLRRLFPNWAPAGDKAFSRDNLHGRHDEIPHNSRIIVVDGIRSVEDFALMLKQRVIQWETDKTMMHKK